MIKLETRDTKTKQKMAKHSFSNIQKQFRCSVFIQLPFSPLLLQPKLQEQKNRLKCAALDFFAMKKKRFFLPWSPSSSTIVNSVNFCYQNSIQDRSLQMRWNWILRNFENIFSLRRCRRSLFMFSLECVAHCARFIEDFSLILSYILGMLFFFLYSSVSFTVCKSISIKAVRIWRRRCVKKFH